VGLKPLARRLWDAAAMGRAPGMSPEPLEISNDGPEELGYTKYP